MGFVPSKTLVVSSQVIQGCGNPKVNPQAPGPEENRHQGKLALQEKPPTGMLEKLVSGPQLPHPGWARGGEGRMGGAIQWPDRCPAGLRGQGPAA